MKLLEKKPPGQRSIPKRPGMQILFETVQLRLDESHEPCPRCRVCTMWPKKEQFAVDAMPSPSILRHEWNGRRRGARCVCEKR